MSGALSQDHFIYKKTEIQGGISPKSIVSSGNGLFSAQNMMYRHTITLYNKYGRLVGTIEDQVDLKEHGFEEYQESVYRGGPVEAAFSHNGKYLWVSQYQMYGKEFKNPGCDACNGSQYDNSFLYKVNTETQEIEKVIEVGAVPKYLAIAPDESFLIVSNWSSGDISVVDLTTEAETKRIKIGSHPRGIAISRDGKRAFVTVMGSTKVADVNLETDEVNYITGVGKSPRHVVLSDNDSLLYIAVNSSSTVVKYNLHSKEQEIVKTASCPRTMILSPKGDYLYVVNYFSDSFTKIATDSMRIEEVVSTGTKPIGITANWDDSEIWVACYSGKIEIFKDFDLENSGGSFLFGDELASLFDVEYLKYYKSDNKGSESKVKVDTKEASLSEEIYRPKLPAKKGNNVSLSAHPDFYSEGMVGWKNENDSGIEIRTNDLVEDDEIVTFEEPEIDLVETEKEVHSEEKIEVKMDVVLKDNNHNLDQMKRRRLEIQMKKASSCTYHVIVGSFSVPENAVNFTSDLQSKGYSAQQIPGSALTYVSAACFDSREAANSSISQISSDLGVGAWIMKR